jgi:hypothetical protein
MGQVAQAAMRQGLRIGGANGGRVHRTAQQGEHCMHHHYPP